MQLKSKTLNLVSILAPWTTMLLIVFILIFADSIRDALVQFLAILIEKVK